MIRLWGDGATRCEGGQKNEERKRNTSKMKDQVVAPFVVRKKIKLKPVEASTMFNNKENLFSRFLLFFFVLFCSTWKIITPITHTGADEVLNRSGG